MKNSCTYTMLCLLALLLCMACETAQEESDSQNTGDSTEMNAEMNAGMNTDDTMEQMNPDPMPEMEMEMEMTDPMDPMDEEPAEVVLTSLRVEADRILNRYHTSQLSVTAIMSDGSEMLIEEGLTWSSSDDNIVTIDEQGVMYGVHMGDFTINVRYEDIEESWSSTVGCRYPNFPSALKYNNVMPSVGWDDAHRADGSEFRFTLKDFYCSEEWDEYTSIIFMIKAAWCAPCTNYVQNELNPIAEELRDDGALILYMEAQDLDFELADSNYAFQHIRRLIGDGIGIRVGDKSTMTIDSQDQVVPGYMQQFISSFPTTVIIRRSDMRIVTDSNRSNSYLPLQDIINNLTANWSDPSNVLYNNCEEGENERGEPNDTFTDATPMSAGDYTGGICGESQDIYLIEETGNWRATLQFDSSVGQLGMVSIPLNDLNTFEESTVVNDNQQIIESSGEMYLGIYGIENASAPYSLSIEVIE